MYLKENSNSFVSCDKYCKIMIDVNTFWYREFTDSFGTKGYYGIVPIRA